MNSASPPPDETLPQGPRTLVSFLLFLHLFALAVAVLSNARPVSALRNQLAEVPLIKPYLQLLHMDLAYNYHLTYATELDFDHFLEVELDWQGEPNPNATVLRLPAADYRGLRLQHDRNLLLNVAIRAETENEDTLLPKAIAARLLREQGITEGAHRIRLKRRVPLTMEEAGSSDSAQRDPFAPRRYVTITEYDARFYNQELIVIRVASELERSSVERNR